MIQPISDFAGPTILTGRSCFLTRHINWFGFFMKSKVLSKAYLC